MSQQAYRAKQKFKKKSSKKKVSKDLMPSTVIGSDDIKYKEKIADVFSSGISNSSSTKSNVISDTKSVDSINDVFSTSTDTSSLFSDKPKVEDSDIDDLPYQGTLTDIMFATSHIETYGSHIESMRRGEEYYTSSLVIDDINDQFSIASSSEQDEVLFSEKPKVEDDGIEYFDRDVFYSLGKQEDGSYDMTPEALAYMKRTKQRNDVLFSDFDYVKTDINDEKLYRDRIHLNGDSTRERYRASDYI